MLNIDHDCKYAYPLFLIMIHALFSEIFKGSMHPTLQCESNIIQHFYILKFQKYFDCTVSCNRVNGVFVIANLPASLVSALCNLSERVGSHTYMFISRYKFSTHNIVMI